MQPWAERGSCFARGLFIYLFIYLFLLFLSVTRHRPPLGQVVVGTLNNATCKVYSPKAFEKLIHKNVTHIVFFIVCKIYFFCWFYRWICMPSGGVEILLHIVTSCYRNQDNLQPNKPLQPLQTLPCYLSNLWSRQASAWSFMLHNSVEFGWFHESLLCKALFGFITQSCSLWVRHAIFLLCEASYMYEYYSKYYTQNLVIQSKWAYVSNFVFFFYDVYTCNYKGNVCVCRIC